MSSHLSFLQQAKSIVALRGNKPFATWYNEQGKQVDEYTFEKLWEEAGFISNALRNKWKVNKGDLVVLCYDFGIHFFAAFLGCLRAGVTAVIVYPPGPPLIKSLTKMNNVINDCAPVLILTDFKVNLLRKADLSNPFSKSRHLWPTKMEFRVTSIMSKLDKASFDEPNIEPQDLAFLQYTSGSTGNPKGVMVTHSALAANVRLLGDGFRAAFQQDGLPGDNLIGFSWLPQYHDLGLIYCCISQFANGWRMHMMSPITFIRNPLLWIDLMSKHKVQWSAAPDFAYRLVTRKFLQAKKSKSKTSASLPHKPIPNLDLSCIHHLQSSSEPIRLETIESFTTAFGDYKLSKSWFLSGYGLAENVVGVCWLKEKTLSTEPGTACDGNSTTLVTKPEFVAVGKRQKFHSSLIVKVVNPNTHLENEDGVTGEIWLGGPSIAAGYFGKPQLSEEVFGARLVSPPVDNIISSNDNQDCKNQDSSANDVLYLRTGDRGFFKDDRLYICGRIKDLIIVNGVNYYPQDIENVVQDVLPSAVRPGCCAAFSLDETNHDGEVVVVFELRADKYKDAKQVCLEVKSAVSKQIGLIPTVVAIQEKTICKTTSGKIQRRKNRSFWHEGQHKIVYQIDSMKETANNGTSMQEEEEAGEPKSIIDDDITTDNDDDMTFDSFLQGLFGPDFDDTEGWTDLDMTSIQSVELSNFVSKQYGVHLPPNFTDIYPTIASLKDHIDNNQGQPIDVSTPDLDCSDNKEIKWNELMLLQSIGIILLLVMMTAPIIPAILFSQAVKWYFLPFLFPVWMLGYTILLIITKWLVIGKYKEEEIVVPSLAFFRWWFVDRAVYVYHFLIGRYILDSPLQWLVYTLLGAKIHPSAKIDTVIQEFDLIEIHKNVSVNSAGGTLRCSKFAYCSDVTQQGENEEDSENDTSNKKVLRFRPITIQANCDIDGYLSPGVVVGEGAIIETRAMVAEGGQIPEYAVVCGNPACQFESNESTNNNPRKDAWIWQLHFLKILSYSVFLYLSFGCLGLGGFIVRGVVISNWEWRYAPIFLTVLSVLVGIVIAVFVNIILKWILIGKRRPGPYKDNLINTFTEWFADYHFKISSGFLSILASNSRTWNVITKLYGMDVDWVSKILILNFPPSKIDLISMENSFSSSALYKPKKDGEYVQTTLNESSIGWNAHIAPGVEIKRGLLHPLAIAKQDIIRHAEKDDRIQPISSFKFIASWLLTDLVYLVYFGMMSAATIPTYELCTTYFNDLSSNLIMIIPVVSLLMVVQSLMMFLVWYLFQILTYMGSNKRSEPWSIPFFNASVTINWFMQHYTLLPLTWGTQYFNVVAKCLGSSFSGKGHVLFWGIAYDLPYLSFQDETIFDCGVLSGHHVVHHEAALGRIHVNGIVHPMTYVMANVTMTEKETGPWMAPVSSSIKPSPTNNKTTTTDKTTFEEVIVEDVGIIEEATRPDLNFDIERACIF